MSCISLADVPRNYLLPAGMVPTLGHRAGETEQFGYIFKKKSNKRPIHKYKTTKPVPFKRSP
jgi:hypothetical protein